MPGSNRLQLDPAQDSVAAIITTSATTGTDISIGGLYRVVGQKNVSPNDWETAYVGWHYNPTTGDCYELQLSATYVQVHRNGEPVADAFDLNLPFGVDHTFLISQTGSVVTVTIDGTQVLSYTDSTGALTGQRIRLFSLASTVEFDSITGSIADNFDSYTAGTYAASATFGGWTVEQVGGGTVKLVAQNQALTLTAATGTFAVAGNAANLKVGRRLQAVAGTLAVAGNNANLNIGRVMAAGTGAYSITGNTVTLQDGKQLAAQTGAFVLAGSPAAFKVGYTLAVSTGEVIVSGEPAALTTSVEAAPPVTSRKANSAMVRALQAMNSRKFNDLQQGLQAYVPLTDAPKTPQTPVKKAEKAKQRQRKALLDDIAELEHDIHEMDADLAQGVPPPAVGALGQLSVAAPQQKQYVVGPEEQDDEEALGLLLNHL